MATDDELLRRAVVFGSAAIYWLGVFIQGRRVRRRIGRQPNLRPRGAKERLLWAGWGIVVVVWLVLPFLAEVGAACVVWSMPNWALHPAGVILGIVGIMAGYAGTLWCYASMGDAWRIGIDRRERNPLVTRGPYGRVRHPIYLFQIVMLAGVVALLPSLLSMGVILLHAACVFVKAGDEETYLLGVHGQIYRSYLGRTGRLLPRIRAAAPPDQ